MNPVRSRGFTLLELLVAMSLLAVIMAGLVSALRGMAQTEAKIDARLQRLDEMRVVRSFLTQTLSRISAAEVEAPGVTGKRIVSFSATSDSLTWVGILPARHGAGGRHFFQVAVQGDESARDLVFRFTPMVPDVVTPDWSNAQSRTLVKGVTQVQFQAQGLQPDGYQSAEPWPQGWQPGWPVSNQLPEQVRLALADAVGPWPAWTIALRPLPQSDPSISIVVIGGSR